MGFITLAVLVTAVTGLVMLLLERSPLNSRQTSIRELRITIPEDLSYEGIFDDVFETFTKKADLEKIRTTNMGTMYELSYQVEIRDKGKEKEFIDELRCRNGNLSIILGLVQRDRNEL
ncbi:MAG: hypothetical protein IJ137_04280 [Eubacterium sp.]|nr:hypothetical protein [Eubacterium sp.]